MTKELKQITNRINNEIVKYLYSDKEFRSLFVVGSMVKDDYQDEMNNDYDVRVIFKEVTPEKIFKFEQYLKNLCKKISNDNLEISCSTLDGPLHHINNNNNQKKLLIHVIIYTEETLDRLSLPNKYQYGNNYKIIYGEDCLQKYKNIKFNLEDILNSYEGLYYCIDMLKKREFRYKTWDEKNKKSEICYHTSRMSEDIIINSCFYAVNTFVENLMSFCKFNNYDIPDNKMIFCIRLLGQLYLNESSIFLLQGLFTKSESILKAIFANPLKETIELLEKMQVNLDYLDSIFPKKEDERIKKYKKYLLRI